MTCGGYDLVFQYSHYTAMVPAPAWLWLIMAPFGALSYPLSWLVWMLVSVVVAGLCARAFGAGWPWVIASAAMIANLWYGQVECVVLLGVTLAWLTIQKRWHPAVMGVAIMLMLIKPQVTLVPAILFVVWLTMDRGLYALLIAGSVSLFIALVSVLVYPTWTHDIIVTMRAFEPVKTNAAIFPFGLFALPLVLLPFNRLTRLQVALAVNLLASPYFQLYHTTTLLSVAGNPFLVLLSWAPVLLGNVRLAWIIPAMFVVIVILAVMEEYQRGLSWKLQSRE